MNENLTLGAEKIAKRLSTAPESAKAGLERAIQGRCSPRAAIKAMCMDCQGFDRQAIADCTAYACPLWAFRPFQARA